MEEPEDEVAKDTCGTRRQRDGRTGCKLVSFPLSFLQVLERDEVSYASAGEEGGVP